MEKLKECIDDSSYKTLEGELIMKIKFTAVAMTLLMALMAVVAVPSPASAAPGCMIPSGSAHPQNAPINYHHVVEYYGAWGHSCTQVVATNIGGGNYWVLNFRVDEWDDIVSWDDSHACVQVKYHWDPNWYTMACDANSSQWTYAEHNNVTMANWVLQGARFRLIHLRYTGGQHVVMNGPYGGFPEFSPTIRYSFFY